MQLDGSRYVFVSLVLILLSGCRGSDEPPPATGNGGRLERVAQAAAEQRPATESAPLPDSTVDPPMVAEPVAPAETEPPRSLEALAEKANAAAAASRPVLPSPPTINDEEAAALGVRKIPGTYLTLYTDLPPAPEIEELPTAFAAAVPLWCEYFKVDPEHAADWRMVGYLIQDRDRFRRLGMLRPELGAFRDGYQTGAELWLYEQPSAYYRRHLLLHEGTHGFMKTFLGGAGPGWYMEGMAELLGTHRWEDGRLQLGYVPKAKTETPEWGRIKLIKDELRAGRGKTIEQIMRTDNRQHLEVAGYAWCWAAASFFDKHPRHRDTFRGLRRFAEDTQFTFSQRFHGFLQAEWPHLSREWQSFVFNIEYGYDFTREAIEPRAVQELPADGVTVTIAADRGWQSSGYRVTEGQTYRIEASGRYQVADDPRPWMSEANGVTLRYHAKRPLGMLLAAIVDESGEVRGSTGFLRPKAIGGAGEARVSETGTLFLRINDSSAELADNAGTLDVTIQPR